MDNENIRIICKVLPPELMSVGISLEGVYDHNYAWLQRDALAVIDTLTKARIPILGGDVFSLEAGGLTPTIDSWSIKRKEDYESPKAFLQESERRAIDYIRAYTKRNGENYCYSFVLYKFPIGN